GTAWSLGHPSREDESSKFRRQPNPGQSLSVSIGDGTIFNGATHVIGPLTPGVSVSIGRNCLFAAHVSVRGSSHHGLWDLETGTLLNPEAGIEIGDHVWVGDQVAILNKARIAPGSVIGARSVVNKAFDEPHVLLAGIPAAVRRRGVDWTNEFPLDNGATPRK
ncbi:acyltransferase, partial [Microbacterium jejuense]|uniref:acyltransferase n=1 Tax=Microbacterium jejuense TaxID=1263637 RepID=UPI0031EB65EC